MPRPPGEDSRALWRVLRYLRGHRLRIAAGLAATAAASLLAAAQPLLMRAVVDQAIPQRRWGLLAALTLGLALVPIVRLGLGTLQTLWLNGTAQQVARQLRVELLDHLLRLPLSFYAANKTGELMTRITSDCGRLAGFVSGDLLPAAAHTLQLVVLVAVLLHLDASLALAVFLVFAAFHVLGRFVGRRAAAVEREWQAGRGEGGALLQELLAGVRTIKAFTREARESARWAAWNARDLAFWLKQTNWTQVLAASNQAMVSVGAAVVLGYGGWQVATDQMTLGTLLAFFALTPQFYATCGALIASHVEIGKLDSYMARVFELLDLPDEHALWAAGAPAAGDRTPPGPVPVTAHAVSCEVLFEQVSFAYEDGRGGLAEVSFRIAPGEFVAFVGPSGGGKSTILDLLMGFYAPADGTIRIGGIDAHEWPLAALRRAVAIVSQDVHVWNASIRANLLYADLYADDGTTEEALRAAVRAAQLEAFIASLPHGYDTVIGERGVRLSGGERQRLAIARALLRDPRLLLLDEATAALDALTERALQEGLRPFLRGRTAVVVAHRLATVLDCDRIFVLANGRIVQQGPHKALVDQPGLYRDLVRAQFRGEPAHV